MIRSSHIDHYSRTVLSGAASATRKPTATAVTAGAGDGMSEFAKLFAGTRPMTPAVAETPVTPPDVKAMFGEQAFVAQPTSKGPTGATYGFNPIYFASDAAAQKLAGMLGGKVTQRNDILGDNGMFAQQQKNNMIEMPNGKVINAGLLANYWSHGYSNSYIVSELQKEING